MLLLDTHVVIWLAGDPGRLSKSAVSAISEARATSSDLFICGVTLFETANLIARKRIGIEASLEGFLEEIETRFIVLPIDRKVALRTVELPASYPKDPIDRVIGATSLVHAIPLVTADEAIRRSKIVNTIW